MTISIEQFNTLATKNDLKKELKNFATKKDLKKELKDFATKKELSVLEAKFDKMLIEVLVIKEDSKNFVTKDEFNERMNEISGTLDTMMKILIKNDDENTSNIAAHDRFEMNFSLTKEKRFDEITARPMKA